MKHWGGAIVTTSDFLGNVRRMNQWLWQRDLSSQVCEALVYVSDLRPNNGRIPEG